MRKQEQKLLFSVGKPSFLFRPPGLNLGFWSQTHSVRVWKKRKFVRIFALTCLHFVLRCLVAEKVSDFEKKKLFSVKGSFALLRI